MKFQIQLFVVFIVVIDILTHTYIVENIVVVFPRSFLKSK
jgi:hypothetical protein